MNNSLNININSNEIDNCCVNAYLNKMNEELLNHSFDPALIGKKSKNLNHLGVLGLNNQSDCDFNGKNIDNSSQLRNKECNKKNNKELDTRLFPGSPYMGRGSGVLEYTDVNSKLNFGEDTRTSKSNNITSSYSADNFIPLVPHIAENIQDPEHIIPKYWVRGGMSTRVVTNNIDYLKSCGFKK